MTMTASAPVLIGVAFYFVFLALIYSSAWLHGQRWFVVTILSWAGTIAAFYVDHMPTKVGTSFWLSLLIVSWLFFVVFYLVAGKYLTQTKLLDLKYQSHPALLQYITENQIHSPLASLLRALGPALFVAIFLLFGLGYWLQSKGAVS